MSIVNISESCIKESHFFLELFCLSVFLKVHLFFCKQENILFFLVTFSFLYILWKAFFIFKIYLATILSMHCLHPSKNHWPLSTFSCQGSGLRSPLVCLPTASMQAGCQGLVETTSCSPGLTVVLMHMLSSLHIGGNRLSPNIYTQNLKRMWILSEWVIDVGWGTER